MEAHLLFYEEFFIAGIYNFFELAKPNNDLISHGEIAVIFGMTPNNRCVVKFIQLNLNLT